MLFSSVEVYLTAYQALTWNGHLKDNETILIHAVRKFAKTCGLLLLLGTVCIYTFFTCVVQGASGVGLAAMQICKALFNNITIITTSGYSA